MEVGLFFGSFNPIHVGHLIIANLVHQLTSVKEIWFVVSPQNPLKKSKSLLHEFDRIDLVNKAIADHYHFRASDLEFNLSRPSYTINTLVNFSEKFPDHRFRLIMGEDNLAGLTKWKNYEAILENYGLIVYPRPNTKATELTDHPQVQMIEAPKMDISASLLRKLIKSGKSTQYLIPDSVEKMIRQKGFYL